MSGATERQGGSPCVCLGCRRVSRLLHEAGRALYGQQWQSALARDLGVSVRTMQRWAVDSAAVPRGAYLDLLRLTQERAAALGDLGPHLREAGASAMPPMAWDLAQRVAPDPKSAPDDA